MRKPILKRCSISPAAQTFMQILFDTVTRFPTAQDCKNVSAYTNIPPKSVRFWFKNRRQRSARAASEYDFEDEMTIFCKYGICIGLTNVDALVDVARLFARLFPIDMMILCAKLSVELDAYHMHISRCISRAKDARPQVQPPSCPAVETFPPKIAKTSA